MALYLDCANVSEVEQLGAAFPIAGVTTNPSLLLAAREAGQQLGDDEALRALLASCSGLVFMQPMGETRDDLLRCAERYLSPAPERVVLKLAPSEAGLSVGRRLHEQGARIAYTAACNVAQVYCAALMGAEWVIPYFGRMRRAGEDPCDRIAAMSRLLRGQALTTRILVASVKSPSDMVDALLSGAHDVTLPPATFQALLHDTLSDAAFAQFDLDWQKLAESHA